MRAGHWISSMTSRACGRRFRMLNGVADITRDGLTAIPGPSISGRRVARELAALIERRGKPGMTVSDNGDRLTANATLRGCAEHRIEGHCTAPGNPMRDTVSSKASTADAGRVSERDPVPNPRPDPRTERGVGHRSQHRAAPSGPRMPDPPRG